MHGATDLADFRGDFVVRQSSQLPNRVLLQFFVLERIEQVAASFGHQQGHLRAGSSSPARGRREKEVVRKKVAHYRGIWR